MNRDTIAIFNLLGALTYKLTGQIPVVSVELEDGSYVKVIPTLTATTFQEADSQVVYQSQKGNPKDYQPDVSPCEGQTELERCLEH